MASKRKEVNLTLARQAKKAKKDCPAEKLKKQLQEIAVAVSKAPITLDVAQMLESTLQLSLGEFSDRRHLFQQQVVDALSETLGEAETVLRKEVAEVRSQRELAAAQKAQFAKDFEEASGKLKTKADEVHGLKVTLAEKATAFRAATRTLAEAEDAQSSSARRVKEAEKKMNEFEAGAEDLKALKVLSPEEDEAAQRTDKLISLMKKYKFEESMLIALPAALAKAPPARGQFDLMALTETEAEIGKLMEEQKQTIAAAAPSQERCVAAVNAAKEHLAAVRAEQRTAAHDFDIGNQEQAMCEAAMSEAQKSLRNVNQLLKRLDTALNNAEVEVELFQQGPLETFRELKDRSTPVPEEISDPVEEQPSEMVDSEIPVAAC